MYPAELLNMAIKMPPFDLESKQKIRGEFRYVSSRRKMKSSPNGTKEVKIYTFVENGKSFEIQEFNHRFSYLNYNDSSLLRLLFRILSLKTQKYAS